MLSSKNAPPYVVTEEDKLWLSRAVAAEGKPYAQVARALVNLFMLQRSKGNTQSLAQLVRAYAQPVNPRWFPGGDLFLAKSQRTPLDESQARARETVHSARTSFAPQVRDAVLDAVLTPYPSDVTDYAVPSLDGSAKGYVARSAPVRGENRFWTRAPGWRGYFVAGGLLVPLILLVAVMARGLR